MLTVGRYGVSYLHPGVPLSQLLSSSNARICVGYKAGKNKGDGPLPSFSPPWAMEFIVMNFFVNREQVGEKYLDERCRPTANDECSPEFGGGRHSYQWYGFMDERTYL